MIKLLFLILMSASLGCVAMEPAIINEIDAEFKHHVISYNEFKKHYTGRQIKQDIKMLFHSLPHPIIGMCYWLPGGKREVYIDPKFWFGSSTSDKDRELLIFHELGHCDLDRDHADPSSIMESSHFGGNTYSSNYLYFIAELFDENVRRQIPTLQKSTPHDVKSCGGIHKKR